MTADAQRADAAPVAVPLPSTARGWLVALGPPLLLLPLAWVPWDLITSGPWLVGGIAALISAKQVVRLAPLAWRRRPCDLPRLVRCAAAVVLFGIALAALQASRAHADGVARTAAAQARSACVAAGRCPGVLDGWRADDAARLWRDAGLTARYRMRYTLDDDGRAFTLSVLHNIDEALVFRGGVGAALSEVLVVDGVAGEPR